VDFEALVMHYLTAQGLFLAPQFSVSDHVGEWSCPDFVALDFRQHEIQVVEVTTAYDISGLIKKIYHRDTQWFGRLTPQLISLGVPVSGWKNIVRAFVRKDRYEHMAAKLSSNPDVRIEALEDIAFSWKWPWDQWKAQPIIPPDATR
jgi:hypothetical protein